MGVADKEMIYVAEVPQREVAIITAYANCDRTLARRTDHAV
jgi:hypothetical protein